MIKIKSGYILPSEFKMVQSIKHNGPKMLLVHKTEFNRIKKIVDNNKSLSKPYLEFLQMIYVKYILNHTHISIVNKQIQTHIGIQKLQALT
jgi:hypothetical protein